MKHLILGLLMSLAMLAQGGFEGPGRYEITNLKSGKVMDLDRNDQTTVIQFGPRGTETQRWDVEPAGAGSFYIRNATNGKALAAPRNFNGAPLICGRFDHNPNQQWRLQPAKDGNLLIVSQWGRTVDVPNGSDRDALPWQIYELNGDSNQRFLFRRVGGAMPRSAENDRRLPDQHRFEPIPEHNREPGVDGHFWDDREQMWKLAGNGVCFYRRTDFRGEALCAGSSNGVAEVSRDDSFGSVRLFGSVQAVEVFDRPDFRGERLRITRDTRNLDQMGTRVGSFRVVN